MGDVVVTWLSSIDYISKIQANSWRHQMDGFRNYGEIYCVVKIFFTATGL